MRLASFLASHDLCCFFQFCEKLADINRLAHRQQLCFDFYFWYYFSSQHLNCNFYSTCASYKFISRPEFSQLLSKIAPKSPPSSSCMFHKMCVHIVLKISNTNKTWQSHQQRLFCLPVNGARTVIVYDKNRFCKISPWITCKEVNSLWFIIVQVGRRVCQGLIEEISPVKGGKAVKRDPMYINNIHPYSSLSQNKNHE